MRTRIRCSTMTLSRPWRPGWPRSVRPTGRRRSGSRTFQPTPRRLQMRDRRATAAAGWVWASSGLLPIAAAIGAAVLFESATRKSGDDRLLSRGTLAWWILGAGVIIAVSGVIDVPSFTSNPLTPAFIAVASLPFLTISPGERVFDFQGAMAAVLGGMAALWVIRAAMGQDPRAVTGRFVRRLAAFASYLFVFDAFHASGLLAGSEWR